MNFFSLFIRVRFKSFKRHARENLGRRWLEWSIPVIIITGLFIGGYTLFLRGASYLQEQGDIGHLLLDRIFYLGWSIIFYLLILSNIITAFSTLYRSSEVTFFWTVPLSGLSIFWSKLAENLVYSSWAIMLLGLPLTLAYGETKELAMVEQLVFFPLGLIPFLAIATASGVSLLMIVIRLSKWFQMRSIFIALGLVSIGFFWMYFTFSQQETLLTGDAASFRTLGRYMANLTREPFLLIPSYWLQGMMNSYASGDWNTFLHRGALIITTALVSLEIARFIARRYYFTTYQMLGDTVAKTRNPKGWLSFFRNHFLWVSPILRGLLLKDILKFVRTPQQWIQFLMLGFFIGIYLLNLSRMDMHIQDVEPLWQTLIYIFNFGFSGFIIAALSVRFVFPLISLEGTGLWIILSAPLLLTTLFKEKFWGAFLLFFSLAETVALVSNYFLEQDYRVGFIATLFLLAMSLSLVSLSLGLGAVFPQFKESNPMRIASGAGGIITVMLSLIYVALMVGGLVWIIMLLDQGLPLKMMLVILGSLSLLNGVTIYYPLKWGHRALLRTEI